jgi:hypothetical protein
LKGTIKPGAEDPDFDLYDWATNNMYFPAINYLTIFEDLDGQTDIFHTWKDFETVGQVKAM